MCSAGSLEAGRPAARHAVRVAAARGLDLSAHRSRRLDAELIASADLIVGMARDHVRDVAAIEPAAIGRTFTLRELASRGASTPRRAGEPLTDWLVRLGRDRRLSALQGAGHDPALDVADPVGGPRSAFEATARVLSALLDDVVVAAALAPDPVADPVRTAR